MSPASNLPMNFPPPTGDGHLFYTNDNIYQWDGVSWVSVDTSKVEVNIQDLDFDINFEATIGIFEDLYVSGSSFVRNNLNVTGSSLFESSIKVLEDVYVSGNLYVTGDTFLDLEGIRIGNSHISSHPTSGILINSPGLTVTGQLNTTDLYLEDELSVDGDLNVSGDINLCGLSDGYPDYITNVQSALDYSLFVAENLDNRLHGYFESGILGLPSPASDYTFKLSLSSSCGGEASKSQDANIFPSGEAVSINATAESNYEFVMWTGMYIQNPTSAVTSVTMNEDLYIRAIFKKSQ